MYPNESTSNASAGRDERGFLTLPSYPSPEDYQLMATQIPTQYTPPPGFQSAYVANAPTLPPVNVATLVAAPAPYNSTNRALLSFGSAVLSAAVYWVVLKSWEFGIGFVVLLYLHELGHNIAMRLQGIPTRPPIFIPLVGAYVDLVRMPKDAFANAVIAIAGPFSGGLVALACLIAYIIYPLPVLLNLAYFGFLFNLFNLIPINPLDGGRVAGAISRWVWPLGIIGCGYLYYTTGNYFLLAILILGLFETWTNFNRSTTTGFFAISLGSRITMTAVYVALAAALGIGLYVTSNYFDLLRQFGF